MKHDRGREPGLAAAAVVTALAGLCLLAGCTSSGAKYFLKTDTEANVYVAPYASEIEKIAIMPFKAATELIGSSVSDIFVTEMLRANRYELVERSQMARVLSEAELSMAGLSSARAVEVGRMLGADGVVIGTVDEYGTVAERGRTYAVAGISARLIDCGTGKVVWSVDLAERAEDHRDTVSQHGREVVHQMTSGLYQQWRTQKRAPRRRRRTHAAAEAPAPVVPAGPPATPQGFQVSDMGLREVILRWSEPQGVAGEYRVERAGDSRGPFKEIARVSPFRREYRDRGGAGAPLEDAATYYYRLVAVSEQGEESQPTRVLESMTAPPPDPPGNIQAEAHVARGVRLTWDESPSEGVTRYVVERTGGQDFVKVSEVRNTRFEEGGHPNSPLKDSTRYFYRLFAVNRVGAAGPPSKPVGVMTRPPPAVVTNLTAGSREVRCVPLAWAASPEEDVVCYDIYRSEGEEAFRKITSVRGRENTEFLDGARDPGTLADETTYAYRVRAVNAVTAESEDSAVVEAATRGAPPEVTGLAPESGRPREVLIVWKASPDEKVVGYKIDRAKAGEEFVQIATVQGRDTTEYLDKGGGFRWFWKSSDLGRLADGTEYLYRVRAYNTAAVESEPGGPAAARTKPAPRAPAGVAGTDNRPRSIVLAWSPNPEADIREYVVEASSEANDGYREAGRVAAAGAGDLLFEEKGLDDGQRRYYRVKAVDEDTLESDWARVSGRARPRPDAPGAPLAEPAGDGRFTLHWTAPEADVRSYKIWAKGMFGWDELGTSRNPRYELDAETADKGLTVAVSAVDPDGLESDRSGEFEVQGP